MVQRGDVRAGGHLKAVVGVAGISSSFQLLVADARIGRSAGLNLLAHGGVLPGIHAAQLPIAVGLVHNGIQQLFQKVQRGVVQRHHDADLRPGGLVVCLPDQQLHWAKRSARIVLPGKSAAYTWRARAFSSIPETPSVRSSCRKTKSGKVCQSWRLLLTA